MPHLPHKYLALLTSQKCDKATWYQLLNSRQMTHWRNRNSIFLVISGALNQATAAAASLPKFGRLPYRCSLVIAQDPTKLYSCRMGLAFFQGRVSVVTFPNALASITFGEVAAVASLGNCLNLRARFTNIVPTFDWSYLQEIRFNFEMVNHHPRSKTPCFLRTRPAKSKMPLSGLGLVSAAKKLKMVS